MQKESSQLRDRSLVKTGTPGIYKRGGRYVVIFRDPQGRQRKRSAKTMVEARELKATLTADVARGEYRAQSRVTFGEYATQWLATYGGRTARGSVRSTTAREYRRYTEQRAIPYFGRRRLADIEPRDVKAYASHVAAQGVSRNTVRNCVAALRVLLATAVEDGVIRTNPAAGVRLPAMPITADDSPTVKALTDVELAALLAACPPQWQLLATFLADTGLRLGEASALRWVDIDFGRRRVQVRRQYTDGAYAPPKSRYGRRDVPISAQLAQQLWERRKAARGTEDALVWPGRGERPLNAATAYRAVRAAGAAAGVPWAHPHALRHTCATRLFRAGLNAKQVQVWMGHHSPAFTLATYVHLLDEDLPDAPFGGNVGGNVVATSTTESHLNEQVAELVVTA